MRMVQVIIERIAKRDTPLHLVCPGRLGIFEVRTPASPSTLGARGARMTEHLPSKRPRTEQLGSRVAGNGVQSVHSMASVVENVAGDSDFPSLTQWLMTNTKDKEVRSGPCRSGRRRTHLHLTFS